MDELLEVWKADCRRAYLQRDDVLFEKLLSSHETRIRELAAGVDSLMMEGANELKRTIVAMQEEIDGYKMRLGIT